MGPILRRHASWLATPLRGHKAAGKRRFPLSCVVIYGLAIGSGAWIPSSDTNRCPVCGSPHCDAIAMRGAKRVT